MSRPRLGVLAVTLALLVPGALVHAQTTPPPIDPALRARFGFVGPSVVKLAEGIEYLRVQDLDGDGKAEITLHDPTRAHVETLRVASDGSVSRSSVDLRGALAGLGLADLRGDGKRALVQLRAGGRVIVELGEGRTQEIEVGPQRADDALRVGDLDGDRKDELAIMTRDGVRCVFDLAGTPRVTAAVDPGELPISGFLLTDADGDGALDLVLGAAIDELPLRVARGDGRGGFGPWLAFPMQRIAGLFPGPAIEGRPTLAAIVGPRRKLVLLRVERSGGGEAIQIDAVPATKRSAIPFAQGDFDGDGDLDLALAQPERAELSLLLDENGRFRVVTVPSFVGISSLAAGDVDGDGRCDLVLASPDEKALAWRSGVAPMDRFPERIGTGGGEPVTVGVAPNGRIFCALRDRSKNATLVTIARQGDGFGEPITECKLGRLAGEPLRLLLGDFDATSGLDVAYVSPGEGLRVARGTAGGKFADVDPKADEGASFAQRIEDGAFAAIVRENAGEALLVFRERFARSFRFAANGQPDILQQRNVPPAADAFDLGLQLGNGALVAIERKTNRLHFVAADGSARSIELPPVSPTHVLAQGEDVLVLGKTGVVRVRRGDAFRAKELASQDPPTDESVYYSGTSADLDADGSGDLAVLDADLHGVQLHAAPDFARALAFPVFELSDADSDLREPREIAAGDVDGDGRIDLVVIAFDRVLVYRQEAP
jgi:hypothetical protein